MVNHITISASFQFDYDGITPIILVSTQHGAVFLSSPLGSGNLPLQYNVLATGVENITVAAINAGSIVTEGMVVSATGSINNGTLTINIPPGLSAGSYYCQTTLIF